MSASHSVQSVTLPAGSALHRYVQEGDFMDCYAVRSDLSPRAAADIALRFPAWAQFLLTIRNAVVKPLGLATEGSNTTGDRVGVFPIVSESATELVAGFDDKHLNFRISVMTADGRVHFATWVHTHNVGGTLYLAAVMPFHVLIVRDALHRVRDGN